MPKKLQQALANALVVLLRPLARVLLNHGMAYGSFAELSRKVFVDEAYEHLERSGTRPTVSSVSALTGLSRKEVKRLRENFERDSEDSAQRYSRAIRVISGWVSDPVFHDELGEPAILPLEGRPVSFTTLVKRYSGDIPPAAMLSLLERSQNVANVQGNIELKERAYIPMSTPLEKIHILGADTSELIATIGHNLEAESQDRLFQRKVSNVLVRAEDIPAFRELSNLKSQQLLEEYHAWLSDHEVSKDDENAGKAGYVAVGIYYVEKSE
ncbi:MAG: hypothetical protein ACJAUG_000588 [Halioglobus sp.]|jgi:hypothetical protein